MRTGVYFILLFLLCPLTVSAADTPRETSVFPLLRHIVPEEQRENLPRPFGLSYIYHTQNQMFGMEYVSLGGVELPEGAVQSVKINPVSYTHSVRADLWLFPFLNVFLVAGKTHGGADVRFDFPQYPPELVTDYQFDRWVLGPGATMALGYGGFFLSVTGSAAIIISESTEPASNLVFQGQFGYSFPLFNLWAGLMYQDTDPNQAGMLGDNIEYKAVLAREDKWNTLIGFRIPLMNKRTELILQQGFGERIQTTVTMTARFGS